MLTAGAKLYVPVHQKIFYKYWWDQELSALKKAAVNSNKLWKLQVLNPAKDLFLISVNFLEPGIIKV